MLYFSILLGVVSLCVYEDKGYRTDGEIVRLLRTKCKVSQILTGK